MNDAQEPVFSVASPTRQGLALYRRVISAGTTVETADAEQQAFHCGPQT